MKKDIIIICSAISVAIGAFVALCFKNTAACEHQMVDYTAASLTEVEVIKPATTTSTEMTSSSTTETTTTTTEATDIFEAVAATEASAETVLGEVVAATETSAETALGEAIAVTETSAETVVGEATTDVVEAEYELGEPPLPNEAQKFAWQIADELREKFGGEAMVPPTWNAWERGLMFSGIYDGFSVDYTEDSATFEFALTDNPHEWKVSMGTTLTDSYGPLPEGFVLPAEVCDYSQFVFDVAESGLDENNLGCYVCMENGDASVLYSFNGSTLSISVKLGEELGYAVVDAHMPSGYVAIVHTEYGESEVFDEYILSAAWAQRYFGACDYRLVELLEEIPRLSCVSK
jgi:hypothetical protein